MLPIHPGRILRRELRARELSANALARAARAVGAHRRHPQRQARDQRRDGRHAIKVPWGITTVLAEPAEELGA